MIKEVEGFEARIAEIEEKIAEIENKLSDPSTYQNGELAASLQKQYAEAKKELEFSFEQWEQKQTELEELLAQLG